MTSSRLPGKVLRTAGGASLLEHHLSRLQRAGLTTYVATTLNAADDRIVEVASGLGVETHRGSERDVLGRYAEAVRKFDLDVVVRVTSDCPLIDGDLVANSVRLFLDDGRPGLYMSNTIERTYPRGMDFEVFWAGSLLRADQLANRPAEREHVTPFLYANPEGEVVVEQVTGAQDHSGFRLTVDTEEDLALVTTLIEDYDAAHLGVDQLVDLLLDHPELAGINAAVSQRGINHTDPRQP